MGEPGTPPPPAYRTGWLWAVLTFFLLTGTVGLAFLVYGVSSAVGSGAWFPGVAYAVVGFGVGAFSLLILAGMLYRVDRLRGVPHRTVRLFE